MVVILLSRGVPLPGGVAKNREPVAWRRAGLAVYPDIPVSFWIRARGSRLSKPRMLVRRVVQNQVRDHVDVPFSRFRDEAVEIGHRPVLGIDGAVISHVVAEIHLRRRAERSHPYAIHAQFLQVIQMRCYAVQIANPVPVCVAKTPGIHLIYGCALPPIRIQSRRHGRRGRLLCMAACQ